MKLQTMRNTFNLTASAEIVARRSRSGGRVDQDRVGQMEWDRVGRDRVAWWPSR
jgi:hypothetical protein